MKREDKDKIINSLTEKINSTNHFYLADISDLNATDTSDLRRSCFKKEVELVVVKNKLLEKAFEKADNNFDELSEVLKGHTSIMFTEQANVPAKLIKEFRKKHSKPLVKAAFAEESLYIGDENLDALVAIKSKNELIGDIVSLLQTPMRNVISALQSSNNILTGVLETLAEKEEK